MFRCQAVCGRKKKEKKMPFRQNAVAAATFLDFKANVNPLLIKKKIYLQKCKAEQEPEYLKTFHIVREEISKECFLCTVHIWGQLRFLLLYYFVSVSTFTFEICILHIKKNLWVILSRKSEI
jgi:hypothetical protein